MTILISGKFPLMLIQGTKANQIETTQPVCLLEKELKLKSQYLVNLFFCSRMGDFQVG